MHCETTGIGRRMKVRIARSPQHLCLEMCLHSGDLVLIRGYLGWVPGSQSPLLVLLKRGVESRGGGTRERLVEHRGLAGLIEKSRHRC